MVDKNNNKPAEETLESGTGEIENPDALSGGNADLTQHTSLSRRIKSASHIVNIYFVAFALIVFIALVVLYIARNSNNINTAATLDDQKLSEEALGDLLQTESNIGDVSQELTIEANTTFNGKILVKDNLDVAGSINVGGPLTLPGITVAGTSAFDEVEVANNLSILGNATLQGSLAVQSGLTVNGDTAINGNLSAGRIAADALEFRGDVQTQRHIDTGGPSPSISKGNGVGTGGTVSISGTDASGTVTINTGNLPSVGILATINFASSYNGTPRVIISPSSSGSARLEYYVSRDTTGFTIRTRNTPSSATNYLFDYWVSE